MNYLSRLVEKTYDILARRKMAAYLLLGVVFGLMLACLPLLRLDHNVQSLMPDRGGSFRGDFELFSYAPFARTIMISLESSSDSADDRALLIETADRLSAELKPPLVTQVVSGISQQEMLGMYNWLFERLPCLFTEQDAALLQARLEPAAICARLTANLSLLHSPESTVMKSFVLKDPLALREILLSKLKAMNMVDMSTGSEGYFLARDGRHLLLLADTPIPLTDFANGRKLLDYLSDVFRQQVPPGIACRVICGHRYTVANAQTIQNDLIGVMILSVAGLVIIVLLFMRQWQAIVVMLIPTGALLAGMAALALTFAVVSAITIGFGSILLGISVDYGLHVFYGMRGSSRPARQTLSELAAPLSICTMTTAGVFAVLLFSVLPVQRQLAVFSLAGLLFALSFALLILPHLLGNNTGIISVAGSFRIKPSNRFIWVWIGVLAISAVLAGRVKIDSNLRAIGMVPQPVLQDELAIKSVWGGVREYAMIFSLAGDMDQAMARNDQIYATLKDRFPQLSMISSAPILPSMTTQQQNLTRWNGFWTQECRAQLAGNLSGAGRELGYAPAAFAEFLGGLSNIPQPFTLRQFQQQCNANVLRPLFIDEQARTGVITLLTNADESMLDTLDKTFGTARVVSNQKFSRDLNRETTRDFIRFLTSAFVLTLLLLWILFRHWMKILLCMIPVITGIVVMMGVMGALGMNFNLINIVAAILIVGLAVDYGIFGVSTRQESMLPEMRSAILVSGLTTFAGFGALMIARHPALYSIGFTVAAGILPAMLSALLVLPALKNKFLKSNGSKDEDHP